MTIKTPVAIKQNTATAHVSLSETSQSHGQFSPRWSKSNSAVVMIIGLCTQNVTSQNTEVEIPTEQQRVAVRD